MSHLSTTKTPPNISIREGKFLNNRVLPLLALGVLGLSSAIGCGSAPEGDDSFADETSIGESAPTNGKSVPSRSAMYAQERGNHERFLQQRSRTLRPLTSIGKVHGAGCRVAPIIPAASDRFTEDESPHGCAPRQNLPWMMRVFVVVAAIQCVDGQLVQNCTMLDRPRRAYDACGRADVAAEFIGLANTRGVAEAAYKRVAQNADAQRPIIQVAMVDSAPSADAFPAFGTDPRNVHSFARESSFFSRGKLMVGEHSPTDAPATHGTGTASIIAGNAGIGIARGDAELSFFDHTSDWGVLDRIRSALSGDMPADRLAEKIATVCSAFNASDGIVIVNLSASTCQFADAQCTPETLRKKLDTLFPEAAASGCLVIQSAGNVRFRPIDSIVDAPTSNIVTVSAANKSGTLTSWTNPGEISALGEGVTVLRRARTSQLSKSEYLCDHRRGTPGEGYVCAAMAGTSAATPIVSGHAVLIAQLLQGSGAFARITPAQRIELVHRILLSARDEQGMFQGAYAVAMAGYYALNADGPFEPQPVLDAYTSDEFTRDYAECLDEDDDTVCQ